MKNLVRRLSEAEERLYLAIQAASIGIWEWDSSSDLFIKDNHVLTNLGVSEDTLVNLNDFLSRILPPEDEMLKKFFNKRNENFEFKYQFKTLGDDDKIRNVSGAAKFLKSKDGDKFIGVILPSLPCQSPFCNIKMQDGMKSHICKVE